MVKQPIDLSLMKGKAKRRGYTDLVTFKDDLSLMTNNSTLYNGPQHVVTLRAKDIEQVAAEAIKEKALDTFELTI